MEAVDRPPHSPSHTQQVSTRTALATGIGLGAGGFLLAITFGALAQDSGWGPVAPVVASALVFSGTAQFAFLETFDGGAGPWAAAAAATMVNLRYLPMALAANPALKGGRARRALEAQAVVDSSWAYAHRGAGEFDRRMLFGATAPQYAAWVGGTILGVVVAPPPHVQAAMGLDVVFPAFCVLLLLKELTASRSTWLPCLTACALVATALVLGMSPSAALTLGCAAALLGLVKPEVAT